GGAGELQRARPGRDLGPGRRRRRRVRGGEAGRRPARRTPAGVSAVPLPVDGARRAAAGRRSRRGALRGSATAGDRQRHRRAQWRRRAAARAAATTGHRAGALHRDGRTARGPRRAPRARDRALEGAGAARRPDRARSRAGERDGPGGARRRVCVRGRRSGLRAGPFRRRIPEVQARFRRRGAPGLLLPLPAVVPSEATFLEASTLEAARMGLEERVAEIIAEQLGVSKEEVVPEASFIDELGADSLDIVELVMAMEEEFDIEIPDDDAEKIQTIGDAIAYVRERAAAAG